MENLNDKYFSSWIKLKEEGDYFAQLCIGKDEKTCELNGFIKDLIVKNFNCKEVFEGHNDLGKDRINMVFIGSQYPNIDTFLKVVKDSLQWYGKPFVDKNTDGETIGILWGFFSIEPLRSAKDKFNVWYIDEQINNAMTRVRSDIGDLCNLPYEYDALYVNDYFFRDDARDGYRSNADLLLLGGQKNNSKFGASRNLMPYYFYSPELFVHESGHALFGLIDEYTEPNQETPNYGRPNCAKNLEEAEELWSDLLGKESDFAKEVKKFHEDHFFDKKINLDDYKVQYFEGGCGLEYGDNRVIKPTKDSIMTYHWNHPIFGAVNYRQVKTVLNAFSGKKEEENRLVLPEIKFSHAFQGNVSYYIKNFGYATHYLVEYKKNEPNLKWQNKKFKAFDYMHITLGYNNADIFLDKNTEYIFRVKSLDEHGNFKDSDYSEEMILHTNVLDYLWEIYLNNNEKGSYFEFLISSNDPNESLPKDLLKEKIYLKFRDKNDVHLTSVEINKGNENNSIFYTFPVDLNLFLVDEEYKISLCVGKNIDNCKIKGFDKNLIITVENITTKDDYDNFLSWPVDCNINENCVVRKPDIDGDGKTADCDDANYFGHEGTDIVAKMGTDIYASLDGEVVFVSDGKFDQCEYPNSDHEDCQDPKKMEANLHEGFRVCTESKNEFCSNEENNNCFYCFDGGNVIIIKHPNSKKIFATRYDHLKKDSILVKAGDKVKKGDKIAEVGSAGKSTEPHLHFEVWQDGFYNPIDPWGGKCGNEVSLWN